MTNVRVSRSVMVWAGLCCLLLPAVPAAAQQAEQPVVVESNNNFADTVAKLKGAIEQNQVMVLFEANHQNMMAMIGVESPNSVTVLFGRPQMGRMLTEAEPRAALEMPMRIAVREMDNGNVVLIYYTPSYLFSHYNNARLDQVGRQMDGMIQRFVDAATN